MKAVLKNYRQSPRKVRLLADLVRGKSAEKALAVLAFANKRAAGPFEKVLRAAIANAKVKGKDASSLYVAHVAVDKGLTLSRFMPRARGSASPINRRSSHVSITLAERALAKGEKKLPKRKSSAKKS